MPWKSEAQRKFMWANHPDIAKRYAEHSPKGEKLPKKLHPEKTVKYKKKRRKTLAEIFDEENIPNI